MPPETRPVTVIVLSWNGLEVTRACISSILELTTHPDFRVTAVDNASTDGTLEYLRSVEGITLIENSENVGFVKGNNAGILATDTDVVLLNNDTEIIQPDWLERIQAVAYSAPDIGVVGCRLVNAEGVLVHAGTYMPVPSYWGQEYPGNEKDVGQYTSDAEVEGVIFACVYIKRELIDKIGPLDEDYFSYYEDTDYCLKAREAGYRVFRCGGATVRHLENASTDLNRLDFSGTFRRSREVFMGKWKEILESKYTRKLTWRSFITGSSLYSRMSVRFLHALDRAGVEMNLGFLEGAQRAELTDYLVNDMKNRDPDRDRPQVVFASPEMAAEADGSYNIAYVFTPYDRFEAAGVKELNRMDEVWVTSDFQREAALASGVEVPVAVVPFGVDPDYFNPGITGFPLSGRFVFLATLEWGMDADPGVLLSAFTREFGPDEGAVLMVMVSSQRGAEVQEAVEAMALPGGRAPVVLVMDHDIPGYQSGCLYRSVDCFVLAGGASEVGPAAAESLACGTPVIATGWGSFGGLPDSGGILRVDYELEPSPVKGLMRARPDGDHLGQLMRRVFSDRGSAAQDALRTSRDIRSELAWDAIAGRIVERLDSAS